MDEDKIDYGRLIISGYYGYKPSGDQSKKLMPQKLILDVDKLSKHYSEYQRIEFSGIHMEEQTKSRKLILGIEKYGVIMRQRVMKKNRRAV